MTRLCSFMLFVVCLNCFICFSIADKIRRPIGNATIKGQVLEASPEQKPIEGVTVRIVNAADGWEFIVLTNKDGYYKKTGLPAGRYTISVSKNGYGDRVGRVKVVAAGGEIFDIIKMRKKDNILTFIQRQPLFWLLGAGITFVIIVALVILFIDLRKPRV